MKDMKRHERVLSSPRPLLNLYAQFPLIEPWHLVILHLRFQHKVRKWSLSASTAPRRYSPQTSKPATPVGNSICLCHMIIYESYESKCKRDNRAETSCRRLRTSLGSFFFRKRRPVWQITCVFINKFSHLRPQVNHCRQIENGLWQSSN